MRRCNKERAMKSSVLRVFGLFVLGAGTSLFAASKLSTDLQNATTNTNVIVQFTSAPTSSMLSSVTKSGGTLTKVLGKTRFALFSLTPTSILALPNNTYVSYASPNRLVKKKLEFAEPTTNANIALQYGFDGTGVVVAI